MAERVSNEAFRTLVPHPSAKQCCSTASAFDPHIIVVNAGANDVPATREVLKSRYKQVLDSLRTVYGPKPHIVFFNAYGWNTREPANYTRQFVKDFKDPNLSVCLFPWLLEHWHGCMTDHIHDREARCEKYSVGSNDRRLTCGTLCGTVKVDACVKFGTIWTVEQPRFVSLILVSGYATATCVDFVECAFP